MKKYTLQELIAFIESEIKQAAALKEAFAGDKYEQALNDDIDIYVSKFNSIIEQLVRLEGLEK